MNKEKVCKKNFLMMIGKVKRKGKCSFVEERRIFKGYVVRSKKGG